MANINLAGIGALIRGKRGAKGVREVAKEIGISSATLSRVENGSLPDLGTFAKICKWLEVDPNEVLGCKVPDARQAAQKPAVLTAHLKAPRNQNAEVARALADMIVAAQGMLSERLNG